MQPSIAILRETEPHSDLSEDQPAILRMHLWLESPEGVLFGMGRLLLLREIKISGSLSAAAARLRMSYRGAWGKIKRTEELLGHKLIEREECRRSGYRLTEYGEKLTSRFDDWFHDVERYALKKGNDILPIQATRYSKHNAKDIQCAECNKLK